jgi:hypothetical protein
MALTIPERHKTGLIKLLRLPDNLIDQMISAFEGVTPKFFPEALSVDVISKVKEVSSADLIEIINALLSLNSHRVHADMSPEELAGEVVGAMLETGIEDIQLSKDNQEAFKQRLIRFFNIEPLLIASKATDVLQSHENVFCGARILTDVRPVFGSDPSVAPNAAVMVHMLNLSYHHEGQLKELYIAMDTLDIEVLREVLDRADLKSQSLKSLIKRAGVTYLDPYDEDMS